MGIVNLYFLWENKGSGSFSHSIIRSDVPSFLPSLLPALLILHSILDKESLTFIYLLTCETERFGTLHVLHGFRRQKREYEQMTPAHKLADSVRKYIKEKVISRRYLGVWKSNGGHH